MRPGINGPWITKSYLEMILDKKGVPHLITPSVTNTYVLGSQGTTIIAPKPIRATLDLVTELEDLSQPWTQSLNRSNGYLLTKPLLNCLCKFLVQTQ
ncbi:hypothetical protein S83_019327 [Arachis hypogaea]